MRKFPLILVGFIGVSLTAAAWAQQDIFVYPAEGQSPEHQAIDEGECRSWASQQTGYDPFYTSGEQDAGKGKVAKNTAIGAVGGAAGGAILGEVIGDKPGFGALAGGALGGFLGNRKGKKSKEEAQAAATYGRDEYNRAMTACLEARGYSVS